MISLEGVVREIIGSALSSVFDPNPIYFKPTDEIGVRPVKTGCERTAGRVYPFTRSLNRNAFLCGCLDYTEHEMIEHLIVGFGSRYGSTTKISAMAHVIGEKGRVSIPDTIRQGIKAHVESGNKEEVLVFHNHPQNLLNIVLDNLPLPSSSDRNTLLAYLIQPLIGIKALLGGGRVRCYLGENGFVQEFRTPELLSLLERLHSARQVR